MASDIRYYLQVVRTGDAWGYALRCNASEHLQQFESTILQAGFTKTPKGAYAITANEVDYGVIRLPMGVRTLLSGTHVATMKEPSPWVVLPDSLGVKFIANAKPGQSPTTVIAQAAAHLQDRLLYAGFKRTPAGKLYLSTPDGQPFGSHVEMVDRLMQVARIYASASGVEPQAAMLTLVPFEQVIGAQPYVSVPRTFDIPAFAILPEQAVAAESSSVEAAPEAQEAISKASESAPAPVESAVNAPLFPTNLVAPSMSLGATELPAQIAGSLQTGNSFASYYRSPNNIRLLIVAVDGVLTRVEALSDIGDGELIASTTIPFVGGKVGEVKARLDGLDIDVSLVGQQAENQWAVYRTQIERDRNPVFYVYEGGDSSRDAILAWIKELDLRRDLLTRPESEIAEDRESREASSIKAEGVEIEVVERKIVGVNLLGETVYAGDANYVESSKGIESYQGKAGPNGLAERMRFLTIDHEAAGPHTASIVLAAVAPILSKLEAGSVNATKLAEALSPFTGSSLGNSTNFSAALNTVVQVLNSRAARNLIEAYQPDQSESPLSNLKDFALVAESATRIAVEELLKSYEANVGSSAAAAVQAKVGNVLTPEIQQKVVHAEMSEQAKLVGSGKARTEVDSLAEANRIVSASTEMVAGYAEQRRMEQRVNPAVPDLDANAMIDAIINGDVLATGEVDIYPNLYAYIEREADRGAYPFAEAVRMEIRRVDAVSKASAAPSVMPAGAESDVTFDLFPIPDSIESTLYDTKDAKDDNAVVPNDENTLGTASAGESGGATLQGEGAGLDSESSSSGSRGENDSGNGRPEGQEQSERIGSVGADGNEVYAAGAGEPAEGNDGRVVNQAPAVSEIPAVSTDAAKATPHEGQATGPSFIQIKAEALTGDAWRSDNTEVVAWRNALQGAEEVVKIGVVQFDNDESTFNAYFLQKSQHIAIGFSGRDGEQLFAGLNADGERIYVDSHGARSRQEIGSPFLSTESVAVVPGHGAVVSNEIRQDYRIVAPLIIDQIAAIKLLPGQSVEVQSFVESHNTSKAKAAVKEISSLAASDLSNQRILAADAEELSATLKTPEAGAFDSNQINVYEKVSASFESDSISPLAAEIAFDFCGRNSPEALEFGRLIQRELIEKTFNPDLYDDRKTSIAVKSPSIGLIRVYDMVSKHAITTLKSEKELIEFSERLKIINPTTPILSDSIKKLPLSPYALMRNFQATDPDAPWRNIQRMGGSEIISGALPLNAAGMAELDRMATTREIAQPNRPSRHFFVPTADGLTIGKVAIKEAEGLLDSNVFDVVITGRSVENIKIDLEAYKKAKVRIKDFSVSAEAYLANVMLIHRQHGLLVKYTEKGFVFQDVVGIFSYHSGERVGRDSAWLYDDAEMPNSPGMLLNHNLLERSRSFDPYNGLTIEKLDDHPLPRPHGEAVKRLVDTALQLNHGKEELGKLAAWTNIDVDGLLKAAKIESEKGKVPSHLSNRLSFIDVSEKCFVVTGDVDTYKEYLGANGLRGRYVNGSETQYSGYSGWAFPQARRNEVSVAMQSFPANPIAKLASTLDVAVTPAKDGHIPVIAHPDLSLSAEKMTTIIAAHDALIQSVGLGSKAAQKAYESMILTVSEEYVRSSGKAVSTSIKFIVNNLLAGDPLDMLNDGAGHPSDQSVDQFDANPSSTIGEVIGAYLDVNIHESRISSPDAPIKYVARYPLPTLVQSLPATKNNIDAIRAAYNLSTFGLTTHKRIAKEMLAEPAKVMKFVVDWDGTADDILQVADGVSGINPMLANAIDDAFERNETLVINFKGRSIRIDGESGNIQFVNRNQSEARPEAILYTAEPHKLRNGYMKIAQYQAERLGSLFNRIGREIDLKQFGVHPELLTEDVLGDFKPLVTIDDPIPKGVEKERFRKAMAAKATTDVYRTLLDAVATRDSLIERIINRTGHPEEVQMIQDEVWPKIESGNLFKLPDIAELVGDTDYTPEYVAELKQSQLYAKVVYGAVRLQREYEELQSDVEQDSELLRMDTTYRNQSQIGLKIPPRFIQMVNNALEQAHVTVADAESQGVLTINFRSPDYSVEGGYRPVELGLMPNGEITYLTDFTYYYDGFLDRGTDFDFASNSFSMGDFHQSMTDLAKEDGSFFQTYIGNLVEYIRGGVFQVGFSHQSENRYEFDGTTLTKLEETAEVVSENETSPAEEGAEASGEADQKVIIRWIPYREQGSKAVGDYLAERLSAVTGDEWIEVQADVDDEIRVMQLAPRNPVGINAIALIGDDGKPFAASFGSVFGWLAAKRLSESEKWSIPSQVLLAGPELLTSELGISDPKAAEVIQERFPAFFRDLLKDYLPLRDHKLLTRENTNLEMTCNDIAAILDRNIPISLAVFEAYLNGKSDQVAEMGEEQAGVVAGMASLGIVDAFNIVGDADRSVVAEALKKINVREFTLLTAKSMGAETTRFITGADQQPVTLFVNPATGESYGLSNENAGQDAIGIQINHSALKGLVLSNEELREHYSADLFRQAKAEYATGNMASGPEAVYLESRRNQRAAEASNTTSNDQIQEALDERGWQNIRSNADWPKVRHGVTLHPEYRGGKGAESKELAGIRISSEQSDVKTVVGVKESGEVKKAPADVLADNIENQLHDDFTNDTADNTAPSTREAYELADDVADGGIVTKFERNIAAITLLKELEAAAEAAGRKSSEIDPTKEQKDVLARYVGWGGMPQAFKNPNGTYAKGWEQRARQLEELLTKEELNAARASTPNAHYTALSVVDAMYAGIKRLGVKDKFKMLEPSIGSGNFVGRMPGDLRAGLKLVGIELDSLTGRIANGVYGGDDNRIAAGMGYQEFHAEAGSFDIVVANPPFGNYRVFDRNLPHLSNTIHNFFTLKSNHLLRAGGIHAFVISRYFMDAIDPSVRIEVAKDMNFLGAMRLPETAFKGNANTEVVTDVVFLQKRDEPLKEINLDDPEHAWVSTRMVYVNDDELEPVDIKKAGDKNQLPVYEVEPAKKDQAAHINSYYLENTGNVLGQFVIQSSQYGPKLGVEPNGDINSQMARFIETLPEGVYDPEQSVIKKKQGITRKLVKFADIEKDLVGVSVGTMFTYNGAVYERLNDIDFEAVAQEVKTRIGTSGQEVKLTALDQGRLYGMIELRETLDRLMRAERESEPDEFIAELRKQLNNQYDAYVRKSGPLNNTRNSRLIRQDSGYVRIIALEKNYQAEIKKDNKSGLPPAPERVEKSDIFRERMVGYMPKAPKVETPADALAYSLMEKGKVDMPFIIESLSGQYTAEQIIESLGNDIFVNPIIQEYEWGPLYLSGNVRKKLAEAEIAAMNDPVYQRNVKALMESQPAIVPFEEIGISFGAHWTPPSIYNDFIKYLAKNNRVTSRAVIDQSTGKWHFNIEGSSQEIDQNWSLSGVNIDRVLTSAATSRPITVMYKDETGKNVVNTEKSMLANQIVDRLKMEYSAWIRETDERRNLMEEAYNQKVNNNVRASYTAPANYYPKGIVSPEIMALRQHQLNVAFRSMMQANISLVHFAGAGKTAAEIVSTMEQIRVGQLNKALAAVPNHLTGQWAAEIQRLYPEARILVAEGDDFKKARREALFGRIATGNWDIVVIGHSQLIKLPIDHDVQAEFILREIEGLEHTIANMDSSGAARHTVKRMEAQKMSLESKLGETLAAQATFSGVSLAQMGIDKIIVDEAHNFKNLGFSSELQVTGMGSREGSQKAFNLLVHTGHLRNIGGKYTSLSATPLSNSISEMYNFLRFNNPKALEEADIYSYDAFINLFAEVETRLELSMTGDSYRLVSRLSKFKNIPELLDMYLAVADCVSPSDVRKSIENSGGKWFVPSVRNGGAEVISIPQTPEQMVIFEEIRERIEQLEDPDIFIDPSIDNKLKVLSDARKATLHPRMFDPDSEEYYEGKLKASVEFVGREINNMMDRVGEPGLHIVFCDIGVPKHARERERERVRALQHTIENSTGEVQEKAQEELAKYSDDELLSIFDDADFTFQEAMRTSLSERLGIPAERIASLHDCKNTEERQQLFARCNNGEVTVLFATTSKGGEGMNVAKRAAGVLNIDIPWRPSDLEQRRRRAERQGNMFFENDPTFEVYNTFIVVEQSTDAWQLNTVESKADALNMITYGLTNAREAEDIGMTAEEYAAIKAVASGSDLVKRQHEAQMAVKGIINEIQLQRDRVSRYRRTKEHFESNLPRYQAKMAELERAVEIVGQYPVEKVKVEEKNDKGELVTRTREGMHTVMADGRVIEDRMNAGMAILFDALRAVKSGRDEVTLATVMGVEVIIDPVSTGRLREVHDITFKAGGYELTRDYALSECSPKTFGEHINSTIGRFAILLEDYKYQYSKLKTGYAEFNLIEPPVYDQSLDDKLVAAQELERNVMAEAEAEKRIPAKLDDVIKAADALVERFAGILGKKSEFDEIHQGHLDKLNKLRSQIESGQDVTRTDFKAVVVQANMELRQAKSALGLSMQKIMADELRMKMLAEKTMTIVTDEEAADRMSDLLREYDWAKEEIAGNDRAQTAIRAFNDAITHDYDVEKGISRDEVDQRIDTVRSILNRVVSDAGLVKPVDPEELARHTYDKINEQNTERVSKPDQDSQPSLI